MLRNDNRRKRIYYRTNSKLHISRQIPVLSLWDPFPRTGLHNMPTADGAYLVVSLYEVAIKLSVKRLCALLSKVMQIR